MIGCAAHAFQDMEALGYRDGHNVATGGPEPDAYQRVKIAQEGSRFGVTQAKLDMVYHRGYTMGIEIAHLEQEIN